MEELAVSNPLLWIRTPEAEKKVVRGLAPEEVTKMLASFDRSFDGKRNRAMILILVDCGLRLGEVLRLNLTDVDLHQQLIKVSGRTGERTVRFGVNTAK